MSPWDMTDCGAFTPVDKLPPTIRGGGCHVGHCGWYATDMSGCAGPCEDKMQDLRNDAT